ncbi:uncharacterized protein N7459_007854 [Penicillium hispanicum]|uniref:uncharacterized protein n=1 Tax=Penicillium hispanicum TaxID=1080232 RepID=UPI0025410795|nr:uncharacterized protein N7459_007854 [Penicillium hispanicum]KAJ5573427.1 hypothetical protein N7459_007854 [Penicillium hispanicum]
MATRLPFVNHYATLGVSIDAQPKEINSAYKRLALIHHPDKSRENENSPILFRQIQEAVEVLRDSERRREHDKVLEAQHPRIRRKPIWEEWYDTDDRPWLDKQVRYNLSNPWERYLYTYGTGVHMNPSSKESRDEQARHEHDIEDWEAEYAGTNAEVQKAKAERRREGMRARVMRDEDEMEAEEEAKEAAGTEDVEKAPMPLSEADEDSGADQSTDYESFTTCSSHSQFHVNSQCQPGLCNSSCEVYEPCIADETATDSDVFYDCTEGSMHDVEEPQVSQQGPNEHEATSQLQPFIEYCKAKLNDPSARYTLDDLYTEIHGLVLHVFCAWLESTRLSAYDDKGAFSNDPKSCSHLGNWRKVFGLSECETCHLWKPIFIVICSDCGKQACVGCKSSTSRRGS